VRRLAALVAGHPWPVVLAWVAGIAALTLWGPAFGSAPHSSLSLPAGTEQARATALERAHFGAGGQPAATVVTEDPAGAGALRTWLTGAPDVADVGRPTPSQDGRAALIPVTFARQDGLDAAIGAIEPHLAASHAAMTGDAVASHDFNAAALGASGTSGTSPLRIITLLIVVVVLALVYRAPLAVLVPLLCVGAAILVSPHLVGLVGSLLHLPVSDFSLLFMFSVTLGAGTNYGLFLISRYREALGSGLQPRPALIEALTHVGEAIAASAATVVVASGLMALASFDLFRTLGPPVAIAVATMLLAGLTLLPALIAICGRAFLWPRRPARRQPVEHGAWRRIGDLVVAHPAWLAAASVVVLLPAAAAGITTPLSFDLTSGLPGDSSTARATAMLSRHFPEQTNSITLLLQPPADGAAVRTAVGVVTMNRLRRQEERTRAALEELRLSREAQVDAARGAERIRLAREMHDVLGHTLSALAVQLEGARLLLERAAADPAVVEAVSRAHRLAREGLGEARRAVGTLRGDDLPGPDLLPGLVEGFALDSGTDARLAVEGQPADLAPDARLALYRTAQEALTNVRRHARATHVELRLRWEPDGAELTVENDGVAEAAVPPRAGYGLAGMRERAELLGGKLELGAGDGTFRVRLWVPAVTPAEIRDC